MTSEAVKKEKEDTFFPFSIPLGMSDLKFMDLLLNTFMEDDPYSSATTTWVMNNGIASFVVNPKRIVYRDGKFGVLTDFQCNNQHINVCIGTKRIRGFMLLGN